MELWIFTCGTQVLKQSYEIGNRPNPPKNTLLTCLFKFLLLLFLDLFYLLDAIVSRDISKKMYTMNDAFEKGLAAQMSLKVIFGFKQLD